MFVLGAQNYMGELATYNPEMASCCQASMDGANHDLDFLRPTDAFLESPSDSIDFAVMEKTERAMVVPVQFGWNDIGSWDAILDESDQDAAGNHFRGDVIAVDTPNVLVISSERMIGTLGIDNVVVVETSDVVLVAARDRAQNVKEIVSRLAQSNRNEQH